MQIKKKQLEKGVTIYFEGLPGNSTSPPEEMVQGFELFVEMHDGHMQFHGWCGMEEPVLNFKMPFLEINDEVHVLGISNPNERTYPNEFWGTIIMLEPSNGLALVAENGSEEYRLVEWGRVRKQ